jgi:predicted DNA-binding antitoxin AbrB/MazE fold protein
VLKPVVPREPEKVEISVDEADDLYREIGVENVVEDETGKKASLKPGAKVDVILEADTDDTK